MKMMEYDRKGNERYLLKIMENYRNDDTRQYKRWKMIGKMIRDDENEGK